MVGVLWSHLPDRGHAEFRYEVANRALEQADDPGEHDEIDARWKRHKRRDASHGSSHHRTSN